MPDGGLNPAAPGGALNHLPAPSESGDPFSDYGVNVAANVPLPPSSASSSSASTISLPVPVPGDPFGAYNFSPFLAEGNFQLWVALTERVAIPPNRLDVNNMCVWDCLGAVLGVDARRAWACWMCSLDPVERALCAAGDVPREMFPRVLAFFQIPHTVYLASPNNRGVRAGAAPPAPRYDPTLPPAYTGPGVVGWPQMTCYLEVDQNRMHLSLRGEPIAAGVFVAPVVLPVAGTIAWASRLVPDAELDEVLNVPRQAWGVAYARIMGIMPNMFANGPPAARLANFVLPSVPVQEQVITYTPTAQDGVDAMDLASDIKMYPQSMNLRDANPDQVAAGLSAMAKNWNDMITTGQGMPRGPVRLHLLHGAYGTGKTYALERLLQAQHARDPFTPATLTFHTWDHDLRKPLQRAMTQALPGVGLSAPQFTTGCMVLAQPRIGTLVLDDAGKCWNSFIPLVIACNPAVHDIYITFDACQAQGAFPTPSGASGILSAQATSSGTWLGALSDYYATAVVRTSDDVTDLYGLPRAPPIPGRIRTRGQVVVVSKSLPNVPLLVVSPRFAETQVKGGQRASTFVACQGHTIDGDVTVDLGGLSATATDHAVWTALTRATGHVMLRLGPLQATDGVIQSVWSQSPIFAALLTIASVSRNPRITVASDPTGIVKSAVLSHMSRCISPAAAARLGLPAPSPYVGTRPGVSGPVRSSWLATEHRFPDVYTARTHRAVTVPGRSSAGPAFSAHRSPVSHTDAPAVSTIVRHFTSLPADSVLTVPATNYRLPPDPPQDCSPDPAHHINEPTDDALREVVAPNANSTFQHVPDGAPDTLHHTRADKMTDALGRAKRIRVGSPIPGWSTSQQRRLRQLKRGFNKFFDVDGWNSTPFSPEFLERCNQEKLASWASKRTKTALVYSVAKQNHDSPHNFVKLFTKGQFIKKKPKWRGHAFPSQIISDFHLGRIFDDSPYAIYMECLALRFARPTTYLHCRASPDDLSVWYRQHWSPGLMTGNDYTAWDSGVDEVMLEFDLWLMNLCGFPQEYIDRIRFERLNTYSHAGPHKPRQESGDRWTWLLNTLRNAALTGASLDCPVGTPVCVSGDDSVTLGAWRRSSGFSPSDWLMTPKREEGLMMEFCGLIFGGPDVGFDPAVVYWRARFGLQQGRSDPDYWRSIRDSIREASSKLSVPSPRLASARELLHEAVLLFSLDPALCLPLSAAYSQLPPPPSGSGSSLVWRLLWLLFSLPYDCLTYPFRLFF